jgi:hypothetical protein
MRERKTLRAILAYLNSDVGSTEKVGTDVSYMNIPPYVLGWFPFSFEQ